MVALSFFRRGFFLLLLLAFSDLGASHLQVRRHYLNPCTLASSIIGTPDPYSSCFYGEELMIYYSQPSFPEEKSLLQLHLLFGNFERASVVMELKKKKGWVRYRLMSEDYDCKGGIVAYKVELFSGERLIDLKCHPLWCEALPTEENTSLDFQ